MGVVMVGGLDNYLIEVAKKMIERRVPVTHFLDRYQWPSSREGVLKSVTNIDAKKFTLPEEILKLNVGQTPLLTAALLEEFVKAELVWLSVTDRYTQTLGTSVRRQLFRELLAYFYRWIQHERVRVIIFPNVPHAGWNNVLYFVAKHLRIKTIILEPTRLNDRVMLWEDYEGISKVPEDFLSEADELAIRQHIDPELQEDVATESVWMALSNEINQEALRWSGPVREAVTFLRALVLSFMRGPRPRDLVFDEPWSWWDAHWRRYRLRRRQRHLRSLYERLVNPTFPIEPYVIFFLNYQPEKTTTPMGGVFDDQLFAVRLFAHALPPGWHLLVKEHPRQFSAHVDAEPFRSAMFYKRLADMPNVQLVSSNASTQLLVAGCLATATITGSIGWQGLLRGKPAFNFGRSWYAACRSCYVVSSVTEVQQALVAIQKTDAQAVKLDVLKFLVYQRSDFIIGGNGDAYVARSKRSSEELAENLAVAVAEKVSRVVSDGSPAIYTPEAETVR